MIRDNSNLWLHKTKLEPSHVSTTTKEKLVMKYNRLIFNYYKLFLNLHTVKLRAGIENDMKDKIRVKLFLLSKSHPQ